MTDPNTRSKTVSKWINITNVSSFIPQFHVNPICKTIQILTGNEETVFQDKTAIAHCISADAKMSKGFAKTICRRVNGHQEHCEKTKPIVGSALPYWYPESNNFIYNLVTKSVFSEKPTLENLRISLENMRGHALVNNITKISMPKIGCGLDKFQWTDVFKLIQDTFTYSGIQIQIITKKEKQIP